MLRLTHREFQILKLLTAYPNGISFAQLQDQLQISRRTLYREISAVETILKRFSLQLDKPRSQGYVLKGGHEQKLALMQTLDNQQASPILDTIQRQSGIVVNLMENEETTLENLSLDFRVSIATIQADLALIEERLAPYNLKLIKERAKGIRVEGKEREKRQIMANLIHAGISEYEFYQFISSPEAKAQTYFLSLLDHGLLYSLAYEVRHSLRLPFERVSDTQMQRLLIYWTVGLSRLASEHIIEAQPDHHLISVVKTLVHMDLPDDELAYMAQQLEGLNFQNPVSIWESDFDVDLSYRVREMIDQVSELTQHDFAYDEALFKDLMSHMQASLKRNTLLVEQMSPNLAKVVSQYENLAQAVSQALANQFHQPYSGDELGYVVLHFATSLERIKSDGILSALLICSSGIGTAKILESQLTKFVPEIKTIQTARISQLANIDTSQYDAILSTVFLPGFTAQYIVISPLLLDEEIQEIRSQLKPLMKKTNRHPSVIEKPKFDDVYTRMRLANQLLQHFKLEKRQASQTIEQTIETIVAELWPEDAPSISQAIIDRYLMAPIGIPNTNLALFHCVHDKINEPLFRIYDLDQTFAIPSMNHDFIQLSRILLLLAPSPPTTQQQSLLGQISSSIIESKVNTQTYMTASQDEIYDLLSHLFMKDIANIWEEK